MSTPLRDGVGWVAEDGFYNPLLSMEKKKNSAQNMSEVFFVEIGNKIIHKSRPLTSRKWTV